MTGEKLLKNLVAISISFFAKKACESVRFGVNYDVYSWPWKFDILTLFAVRHRGLL